MTFSKAEYSAAIAKLFEFPPDRAAAEPFEGRVEEWEVPVFNAFILYGARDANHQRLVDRYLATRGRLMEAGQVAVVHALQAACVSLFEIEAVQLHSGLDVRDLLTGERIHIDEVSGTVGMKKWDVLFGWTMKVGSRTELTGAQILVPREHVATMRAAITDALELARVQHPDIADRDLVGAVAWAPMLALRAAIQSRPMPELHTTSGEALVFCKAHYAVRDPAFVRSRMEQRFEADGDRFTWLEHETVLGSITLDGDQLVLETMAIERNARGKQLLEALLGATVVHRADSIQDVHAALETHRASAPEEPADAAEILGKVLRDHYATWLDEPLPALGDKTPRQAVRTQRGRVAVAALLRDIEHGTQRQPGGETVDFAAMRRELGLDEEP